MFDRFDYDWPEDLAAAQELLDAVFCNDRDYLREHGYLVPPKTPLTDLSLIGILFQMPRSITGQPAPTANRVISATGQDITGSATALIQTYGMSPEEALRSLVLQTIYATFAPFTAENFGSRPDSASWWIDHENGSRLVLASTTDEGDEGDEAAKLLLADTGLDFTVIRVPFSKRDLDNAHFGIFDSFYTNTIHDPDEIDRRLGQITAIETDIVKGEMVVTLSPLADDDIADLVAQLVAMYEPARLVIGE
ncbi:MAG: hypothetical protein GXP35_10495 [Actinobacteria bacterium]|nr:hypothetical protein [Actinomycetota bacterium]